MSAEIRHAITPEDRHAIFRLRYDIYIQEIGYKFPCDHDQKIAPDVDNRASHLVGAFEDGAAVGTLKFDWGAEVEFIEEDYESYDLRRFLPVIGPAGIAIFTRYMVAPEFRSGDVPARLFDSMFDFLLEHRVPLLFCDCRPHLISTYERLGFRTYAPTFNHPAAGILVPLVLVIDDTAHLRRIGSRLLAKVEALHAQRPPDRELRSRILALIPGHNPVHTLANPDPEVHHAGLREALPSTDVAQLALFANLDEADIARIVAHGHIIECSAGDRIVVEDVNDTTVFLVLEGVCEVRRDNHVLAVLTAGAVFGEIAFLLQARRTADVYAVSPGVRVLALRQKALAQLIESESAVAARLLLNLARILAVRLAAGQK